MSSDWSACHSVEHYERLSFVDEGAHGRLLRARETAKERTYALASRTSRSEVTTLFVVAHANVVALREVVVSGDGLVYMLMEYAAHGLATSTYRLVCGDRTRRSSSRH